MKVSCEENLANCFGLERRGGCGNAAVLSVRGKGNAGQPLSSEITTFGLIKNTGKLKTPGVFFGGLGNLVVLDLRRFLLTLPVNGLVCCYVE